MGEARPRAGARGLARAAAADGGLSDQSEHEHVVLDVRAVPEAHPAAGVGAQDRVAGDEHAAPRPDVAEALHQGADEAVVDRNRIAVADPHQAAVAIATAVLHARQRRARRRHRAGHCEQHDRAPATPGPTRSIHAELTSRVR
jgi:hypothetical protein